MKKRLDARPQRRIVAHGRGANGSLKHEKARPRGGHSDAASEIRSIASSLALGLVLAVLTSGSLLYDRVTEGSIRAAVVGNVVTTAAVVAVVLLSRGRRTGWSALAGLALGVALVHTFVRIELQPAFPWLAERPAQFVNDLVAALAALTLAAAFAKRPIDVRLLLVGSIVVAAYALTRSWWHVDVAPHAFAASVQQCVVASFLSATFGLLLFLSSADHETRW